jgi:hypothetical protein
MMTGKNLAYILAKGAALSYYFYPLPYFGYVAFLPII